MHYGVVDDDDELVHYVDIPLPGPRLPHDMAFTENYVDTQRLPAVLGPELLKRKAPTSARFHPDMPRGSPSSRAAAPS